MRKKRIFVGILVISIFILSVVIVLVFKNSIEKRKHQRLMEETIQEIERINNNSYFWGMKLLDLPPKDYKNSIGNDIYIEEEKAGYYNCWEFNNMFCISQITLYDSNGNLLGMHSGDSYEDVCKILSEEGYVLCDKRDGWLSDSDRFLYEKAYVTIGMDVSAGNIVKCIWVAVDDPTLTFSVSD